MRFLVEVKPANDGMYEPHLVEVLDEVTMDGLVIISAFLREYCNTLSMGVWIVSVSLDKDMAFVFDAEPW